MRRRAWRSSAAGECRRASSSSRGEVSGPGGSPGPRAARSSSHLLLDERLDALARCAAGNESFHETCPQPGWGPSVAQTLDGALDAVLDGPGTELPEHELDPGSLGLRAVQRFDIRQGELDFRDRFSGLEYREKLHVLQRLASILERLLRLDAEADTLPRCLDGPLSIQVSHGLDRHVDGDVEGVIQEVAADDLCILRAAQLAEEHQ